MRIVLLFLSVMLAAVSAAAQSLCDPAWLAGASGAAVQAQIRAGADVDQICNVNRNRPLHQAILTAEVGPDVFRALVGAGADTRARNRLEATPHEYALRRWDRASAAFREGSDAYRRELAIYGTFVRGGEAEYDAVNDAHAKLCDLNWWRRSGSGPAVQQLLSVPGVDPDYICNLNDDRIIHQPLKLASFTMLTSNIHRGIKALVDGGAALYARNNSGDTAVSLADIRYDRVVDRMIQHETRWCRNEIMGEQLENEIVRNLPDKETYLDITSSVTGRSYNELSEEMAMELYRTSPAGTIDYRVLCPYRGINVR